VCFGPVVTAVSPVSELRGTFSWARTSFHEFTHVIHLGLSHNRCPRWITEGLATWEEVNRRASWTRNMRRELLDARASGELIGVRDLNRSFRGPRILFAYYQSGLWCQMMIERYGFPKLVHLLEAFDRGEDLDQALKSVFALTPAQIDRQFEQFVDAELAELRIEPRWSAGRLARLQLELPSKPPSAAQARAEWIDATISLAVGRWQTGARIDAEQVLLRLQDARETAPRALFLRGEMALTAGDKPQARALWKKGLELGGEDYRVRFALGRMAEGENDLEEAERQFLAAEKAFPGYDELELCAELALAKLYKRQDRTDDAQAARARWLDWNSGEYTVHMEVAAWHSAAARWSEAERLYSEANEVDPFRRKLHRLWADVLVQLGRHAEALREYHVVALVPVELDLDKPEPLQAAERADLLGLEASCLVELGRSNEALERIERALTLDPECASAKAARARLP
jgi:tetratricopeptide (TPR) repeat protein